MKRKPPHLRLVPTDREKRLAALATKFGNAVAAVGGFRDFAEISKRIKAAEKLPRDHEAFEPWRFVNELTPGEARVIWKYLPDPLKRRGRPCNNRMTELAQRMDRIMQENPGARPFSVARALVGGDRDSASDLLKLWKKGAGKNRGYFFQH